MLKYKATLAFDDEWQETAGASQSTARAAKGNAAKLVGTNVDETIRGTAVGERIDGKGGSDLIIGMGGSDTIKGGKGNGNDFLAGDGIYDNELRQKVIEFGGGDDVIDGGGGNDTIDGGNGNDLLKGGSGDDYVFGGYGGRDVVDGGSGNDRIIGGFRGPGAVGSSDNDILIGGAGSDIFEARTWIQDRHVEFYGTRGLSTHQDVILDFSKGEDRLDMVLYRFDDATTFRRGGFELFDSDFNGVLDARDRFVDVEQVTANGRTALSTVLDVGSALQAAGLVGSGELDSGPHELTLHGVTGLGASDFVPTRTYTFLSGNGTIEGGAGDQWLFGSSASQTLDGGAGNDLLWGKGGRDTFIVGQGRDEIMDFTDGEDRLVIRLGNGTRIDFSRLDSNRNGVLDDADSAVSIRSEQLLAPGEIPTVAESTYIDLGALGGGSSSVLLFGASDLTAANFG